MTEIWRDPAAPVDARVADLVSRMTLAEKVDGRKQLTGDLVGVDGDRVTIDVRGHQPMTVTLAQIADAKLLITDRLIAATQPLSTEGADEEVEYTSADADTESEAEETH